MFDFGKKKRELTSEGEALGEYVHQGVQPNLEPGIVLIVSYSDSTIEDERESQQQEQPSERPWWKFW